MSAGGAGLTNKRWWWWYWRLLVALGERNVGTTVTRCRWALTLDPRGYVSWCRAFLLILIPTAWFGPSLSWSYISALVLCYAADFLLGIFERNGKEDVVSLNYGGWVCERDGTVWTDERAWSEINRIS